MRGRTTAMTLKAGDLVELRNPAEILATLDETGSLDGLPFMPEMLEFFGQRVRVKANLERVCDTIQPIGVRKIPEAVLLDDLRCNGSGHGGCQAQCRLYWKEAWLRPSSPGGEPRPSTTTQPGYEELERLSRANVRAESSTTAEPRFRCQATELRRESVPVPWRDVRSFLRQLTSGNVGLVRFVRVMVRAASIEIGRRLGLVSRFPFMPQTPPRSSIRSAGASQPPRDLGVARTLGGVHDHLRPLHHLVRQRVASDAPLQLGTLLLAHHDHKRTLGHAARFDDGQPVPSTDRDRISGRVY